MSVRVSWLELSWASLSSSESAWPGGAWPEAGGALALGGALGFAAGAGFDEGTLPGGEGAGFCCAGTKADTKRQLARNANRFILPIF